LKHKSLCAVYVYNEKTKSCVTGNLMITQTGGSNGAQPQMETKNNLTSDVK
jgi:hypothetical protein